MFAVARRDHVSKPELYKLVTQNQELLDLHRLDGIAIDAKQLVRQPLSFLVRDRHDHDENYLQFEIDFDLKKTNGGHPFVVVLNRAGSSRARCWCKADFLHTNFDCSLGGSNKRHPMRHVPFLRTSIVSPASLGLSSSSSTSIGRPTCGLATIASRHKQCQDIGAPLRGVEGSFCPTMKFVSANRKRWDRATLRDEMDRCRFSLGRSREMAGRCDLLSCACSNRDPLRGT